MHPSRPLIHPRRRRRLIAVAVPIVLLAVCGSDDADDAGSSPAATEATAAATTAATTAATAATTEPPTETSAAEPADTAPSAGGAVTPGLEDFCAIAIELTEQESLPTSEQLEQYAELAPDEIAAPTAIVVAGFAAHPDDPAAIFSDPEVGAALETLTAVEAEACGLEPPQPEGVQEIDASAIRIDVSASDYRFDADLPTTPGAYSFVMTNEGEEPHMMILLQLEEGATLGEVMASEGESGVSAMFESSVAIGGSEAVITADLTPGQWVMVCPIPDGVPHIEHGMITEFTVA